ncbi:Hypothetical protein A7982_04477 [Minicystis rosea]|nr:Hypothetical protein A7982_04477 [Minicystis rosea]
MRRPCAKRWCFRACAGRADASRLGRESPSLPNRDPRAAPRARTRYEAPSSAHARPGDSCAVQAPIAHTRYRLRGWYRRLPTTPALHRSRDASGLSSPRHSPPRDRILPAGARRLPWIERHSHVQRRLAWQRGVPAAS